MNKPDNPAPDSEPGWIDRHSVNCFVCGELVDERDCIPGPEGEGDICPECQPTNIDS